MLIPTVTCKRMGRCVNIGSRLSTNFLESCSFQNSILAYGTGSTLGLHDELDQLNVTLMRIESEVCSQAKALNTQQYRNIDQSHTACASSDLIHNQCWLGSLGCWAKYLVLRKIYRQLGRCSALIAHGVDTPPIARLACRICSQLQTVGHLNSS